MIIIIMKRILLVIVAPYGAAKEKIKRYDSLCGSLWLAVVHSVARCGSLWLASV